MNLRDQLKKAKLLSDKDARRLAHEARVQRKQKGRAQLEEEQVEHRGELAERQAQQRRERQRAELVRESERQQHAERAAVDAIVASLRKPASGPVKFYFETPEGALPWLELQPQQARELSAAQCCIVRAGPPGSHDYRLLDRELAGRVAKVYPDVVVFAAGQSAQ